MRYLKWFIDLLLAAYMAVLAAVTLPAFLGLQVYTVVSASMEPALSAGTAVYTAARGFDEIREGDIITFRLRESGIYVTHRVISKDEESRTFQTKGDANSQPDGGEVAYEDVAGRVQFAVPYLGCLAMMTGNMGEKLLLAGVLLWLLLINGILTNLMETKRKEVKII